MTVRNALKTKAVITGNIEDYENYKKARNTVASKIRHAERVYYDEKFADAETSSKDIWRNAYQVLGSS